LASVGCLFERASGWQPLLLFLMCVWLGGNLDDGVDSSEVFRCGSHGLIDNEIRGNSDGVRVDMSKEDKLIADPKNGFSLFRRPGFERVVCANDVRHTAFKYFFN
jgi:hypothetical protein